MKRKDLHLTESRKLTVFKKFNPEDFETRKEALDFRNRQQRIIYYIIAISSIIIALSLALIAFLLTNVFFTQPEENPQPTPYKEITLNQTELETIKTKLNFGAPNPPGQTVSNAVAIIEYFKTQDQPILMSLTIGSIEETTSEQTYFIEEILSTYGELETTEEPQKYWLTKIVTQANKDEWNEDIKLTDHIIPKSTPSNIVEEILITNWKDCDTETEEKIVEGAEIIETTYCLIFSTNIDNKPTGIKYVGQDIITPNEYSVYNGKPLTIEHTPET